MSTPEPSKCPACAAGIWIANCTYGEPEQADHGYYPHDWRDAANALEAENATLRDRLESQAEGMRVACARFEAAEARVIELRDTLAKRSEAVNRTGADNDRLRATIARVEKLATWFESQHNWRDWGIHSQIRTALAEEETP